MQIKRDKSTSKTVNLSGTNWKNSNCIQDRTKAVDENSCPIQVDKNQKRISMRKEDHFRYKPEKNKQALGAGYSVGHVPGVNPNS